MKKQSNNRRRSSRISWALSNTRNLVDVAESLRIVFSTKETLALLHPARKRIIGKRLDTLRNLDNEINALKVRQEIHVQALSDISKNLTLRGKK